MADCLDCGFRCEARFSAAREEVQRRRLCAREEEKVSESGRGESSTSVATFDLLLPAHHETTTPSSTPTPQPPKKLKAKKQEAHATAASEAEFDRLRRRAPQHCGADSIWSQLISTAAARGTSRGWPRPTRSSW